MLMLHSSAALYVAGLEPQMAERDALARAISNLSVGITRRWTHKQLQSPSLHRIFVKMSKEKKAADFFRIRFFILEPSFHVPPLYRSVPATCHFNPASLSTLKALAGTPRSGQSRPRPAATCQGFRPGPGTRLQQQGQACLPVQQITDN